MSFTLKLIETLVGMLHVMNMDLSEILQLTSHMIYMKFKKLLEIS